MATTEAATPGRKPVRGDVVAGITAAAVVIPKALAYATIAGLPIEVGLYTAFVPMLVYVLLGTSRPLSVSTTTTIAILTGAELSAVSPGADAGQMIVATATLTLMVGAILLAASLLRLGFVANFISLPVLVGFKAGIGVVIIVDQLPKLLGLHFEKGSFLHNLGGVLGGLGHVSWPTFAVGAGTIAVLVLIERWRPRWPAPLIAVAAAIAGAALLGWQSVELAVLLVALLMIPVAALGTLVEYLQAGPVMAFEKVAPKMEHLNPAAGIKRMFSLDNLVELAKGILKTALLVGIGWAVARLLLPDAMKLALADTWHWVADSRHMTKMKAADLLDDAYLAERARLISKKHTVDFRNGTPPKGGTAYLAAADDNGMMVSFIQSNCLDFGSGIVVPETGISLHNQGACFTLSTKHPNCVAPGKHPLHTLSPGFVTREGKPQMSFGITGGSMQPQGHLQTLVRMLGYGYQPQAACDAPRWKIGSTGAVGLEEWMLPEIAAELAGCGHQIETEAGSYLDFGAGQFVWKTEHGYIAASDPRRDGQAAGF